MARIYPLFSSSKGNAIFVGSSKAGVLIDVGVSFKRMSLALERSGLTMDAVKAVFLTHDHSDHIGGIGTFSKRTGVPVYANEEVLCYIAENGKLFSYGEVIDDRPVEAAGMQVESFPTPHDSLQSCGYRITFEDGRTCAVCTDLGRVTGVVREKLSGCNLVLLESNYDDNMLRNGEYPPILKKRIRSDWGHLSNDDCGREALTLLESGTTRIILGHLSQDNNTPQIAEKTVDSYLCHRFRKNVDYQLSVAPVETNGACIVF